MLRPCPLPLQAAVEVPAELLYSDPGGVGGGEIVLLVAPPAAGKSSTARRMEAERGYVRINQGEAGRLGVCEWVNG